MATREPRVEKSEENVKFILPVRNLGQAKAACHDVPKLFPFLAPLTGKGSVSLREKLVQIDEAGHKRKFTVQKETDDLIEFLVFEEHKGETYTLTVSIIPDEETEDAADGLVVVTSKAVLAKKSTFEAITACFSSKQEDNTSKNLAALHFYLASHDENAAEEVAPVSLEAGVEVVNAANPYIGGMPKLEVSEDIMTIVIPVNDMEVVKEKVHSLFPFLNTLLPIIEKGTVSHVQGTPNDEVGAMFNHEPRSGLCKYTVSEVTENGLKLSAYNDKLGAHTVQVEVNTGAVVIITAAKIQVSKFQYDFMTAFACCFTKRIKQSMVNEQKRELEHSLGALQYYLEPLQGTTLAEAAPAMEVEPTKEI